MTQCGLRDDVYLARQPIFDANLRVFGYELLYREGNTARAQVTDGNRATASLMINTFLEIGIDRIIGDSLAFVNLTRDYLTGKIDLPLPPHNVVLEILEDVTADAESVGGLRELFRHGYTIALDDFILKESNGGLLPYAHIIKMDVLSLDAGALGKQVARLSGLGKKLLAEKVETQVQFQACKELGFHYFQGYFFAKPKIISGAKVHTNKLALMEVIARLQSPDCGLEQIRDIISRDVGMSFKLLKIINSSFYGLARKVESLHQALVILGLETIKKWIMVMSLTGIDDKPTELLKVALLRARMCERLAERFSLGKEAAFTVGLFSVLDVLMDMTMADLLDNLPVSEDIAGALLHRAGHYGDLLNTVVAYEKGQWEKMGEASQDTSSLLPAYLDALAWSFEVTSNLDHV